MEFLTEFPEMGRQDLRDFKKAVDASFKSFSRNYGDALESFFEPLLWFLVWLEKLLTNTPWPIIIAILSVLAWLGSRSWKLVAGTAVAFVVIGYFGMWEDTMATLAIISVATLLCISLGIPLGIWMARSNRAQATITPILDVMQTIPSFVYLIPVVMLLGIGKVPGLIAVCIYAIPPIVRLTNLGIRLVDKEVLEAADAFGADYRQRLFGIQIPLALPNIFAGVNQTIMMSLAMVVIASMIGVKGLGVPVLRAISNQYLALGLLNGLAIVTLAIIFDRVSQEYGRRLQAHRQGLTMTDKIKISNLYKVFGKNPTAAMSHVRNGTSKQELLDEHGHVLGLRDINIDIPERRIQVIMGLSGSGKSTLIRHINRLIEPTEGQVIVDGVDVLTMSPDDLRDFRRHKQSMVFQKFALLPHRTVAQNAAYGLTIQGIPENEAKERAQRWIDRVGLGGFENHYPAQLSGGMQQRVGLARALATDAEILLMDEAFSALDPLIRTDMQDILLDLQEELHKTIVFITHDLDEALRIGDRISILRDGEIVQQGDPQDIIMRPADDYISDFIKDINRGRVIEVRSVMTKSSRAAGPKLAADMPLEDALQALTGAGKDSGAVVDGAGKTIGRIEMGHAISAMARPERDKGTPRYK